MGEEESKALDNLMEIDLSELHKETLMDSLALEDAVLKTAPRWWHGCSLIDELPKVHAVRESLVAVAPNHVKRLEFDRRRQEALEHGREKAAKQKEDNRLAMNLKREEARKPWLAPLEQLNTVRGAILENLLGSVDNCS